MAYNSLGDIVLDMAEVLKPPQRLTVASAATQYRYLNNPGSYVGPWDHATTPYLVEPMESLTDRNLESVIFVGPAQAGKTEMSLNWVNYSVTCDPMDMILYDKSQVSARDFSRRRIDRLHRYSPEVGSRLLPQADADNTFDKYYKSGMILTLSWPSIAELSGRPVGRVGLMDYDRMPMDVDGEGSPFDLARKRTTTFGTSAMTLAESSPGFSVEDPKWIRRTPHEAPPTTGILALYNRGDRRRWYWKCPDCGEWFEPEFSLLKWLQKEDAVATAKSTLMMCPHCASLIPPSMKAELNKRGRWLQDGLTIDALDRISGTPFRSDIASFWLKGAAAAFAPWHSLVARYITAEQEYERTGSQEALKATVNTDQGEPYYPRGTDKERLPDDLKAEAIELPKHVVPEDCRFLMATCDVQKNRFVVQVYGVGPGPSNYKLSVIDRFEVIKSNRVDDDGDRLWVKPGSHLEDWDLLDTEVRAKRYEMQNGGTMGIAFLGCDSGGKAGVTTNAYNWWRKVRKNGAGEHRRTHLLKGDSTPGAPRTRVSYPDSQRKDRNAGARGEIPVLLLNVNLLKDEQLNMLDRKGKDPSIVYPAWLPDEWFAEMCSETRGVKGWENPRKARNEAWDLNTYAIGMCIHLKADRINWDSPPDFAQLPDKNPYVTLPSEAPKTDVAQNVKGRYSPLSELAAKLA